MITDTERIDALADEQMFDAFGEFDLHEIAFQIVEEAAESGTEATEEEISKEAYRQAFREMVDTEIIKS